MTWAARGRRHTESFPLSFLFRVAGTITNHQHSLFPRTNSIVAVCFWLGRRNPSQVFVNLFGSESRKRLCDMNIYNRCFDDQGQLRIRLETAAIEGIFEFAEGGALELVWSFMLDYENSLNPHEDRKEWVELSSRLCTHRISPSPRILALASRLAKSVKIKPRDALHLACAETGKADYFVTCDDNLIRMFQRRRQAAKFGVKAINPVEFIRKEGEPHG